MAAEAGRAVDVARWPLPRRGDALAPMLPGALLTIAHGALSVDIAPRAGGRLAQVRHDGIEFLVGADDGDAAALAWGCYPMAPWAGRVRDGRFTVAGVPQRIAPNLGAHAIHGVAFALPWVVDAHSAFEATLSLALPSDARWPYGGTCRQRIVVGPRRLSLGLSVTAGDRAMPATIGWHPWLCKPDALAFSPVAMYPRDADGIATLPTVAPAPGPWDDCFVNTAPVVLERAGQRLRLTSGCDHWVVYDVPAHATCIEPQTGPPDAFNLAPPMLAPGATLAASFDWDWL